MTTYTFFAAMVWGIAAGFGLVMGRRLRRYRPRPYVRLKNPSWVRDAVIYQINTRQFTREGTLGAATGQLPRLKALGVTILWLMPVHPIGIQHRKGSLGSPYSVRDYYAVSPELGTLEDLKELVATAHSLQMYVILDWVANHTAWDNPLVKQHPSWYKKNWKGELRPDPWHDWSDIITLDYSHPGLRRYMTRAMKYWVKEVGVDGFRADVADFVPIDFWENLRRELESIKPVFMLAEAEMRDLHARAFDMSYAWSWYDAMRDIASGGKDLTLLRAWYARNEETWPREAIRMTFVSNHDKNSWEGTMNEVFGKALEAAIVLSVLGEGMPLVYNGQEAGENKRLAFFEKDPIVWQQHPIGELYRKLIALKKQSTALWNGNWGARMVQVPNSHPDKVFSFVRKNQNHMLFVGLNLSAEPLLVSFEEDLFQGKYINYFTSAKVRVDETFRPGLKPWGYLVLVK